MKIILLKDVAKIGKKFEVKNVSDGYALNLLIPKGLAVAATNDALKRVEAQKAVSDAEKKIQDELLAKNIAGIQDITITISGKANEKGHLFAGLHREAISNEIAKQTRLMISPEAIQLDHPIKEVGEHAIIIKAGDKTATFTVVINKA